MELSSTITITEGKSDKGTKAVIEVKYNIPDDFPRDETGVKARIEFCSIVNSIFGNEYVEDEL